eukprot:TRINITY_DN48397_c0_g1_i1.p1 TRINITY_DN48397_c0_g1~~TRINITY_DN48397_c0_g1_i1.p1  ORF type:complete len:423 (+),score=40.13 TRINITY_DN48397_c0_g1_i1:158-1426(+)
MKRECLEDAHATKRPRHTATDEHSDALPPQIMVRIAPLSSLGADVRAWSAADVANMVCSSEELSELASALSTNSLLVFHGGLLCPSQLRALYTKLHRALGMGCALPSKKAAIGNPASGELRGASFPGFPETNVLGCADFLQDWHGLSGRLRPGAWWEEESCQFHHDGGFSVNSPPPPALVAMYCEETPTQGGSTLKWGDNSELRYAPGATLFYSTRVALQVATVAVVKRARAMTCCYREGFGQVQRDVYPIMSSTGLVPSNCSKACGNTGHQSITDSDFMSLENFAFDGASPPKANSLSLYGVDLEGIRVFRHALVQHDSMGEYILVHAVCLDHLEEEGRGALTWEESVSFIENLLAPAARPLHMIAYQWRPGDVVVFDNRCLQHSVTPTHRHGDDIGYVALGQRRLMTRTAMQPTWLPSVD